MILLLPFFLSILLSLIGETWFKESLKHYRVKWAILPSTEAGRSHSMWGRENCPSLSSTFNHRDFIRWTVQITKFLIVNEGKKEGRKGRKEIKEEKKERKKWRKGKKEKKEGMKERKERKEGNKEWRKGGKERKEGKDRKERKRGRKKERKERRKGWGQKHAEPAMIRTWNLVIRWFKVPLLDRMQNVWVM